MLRSSDLLIGITLGVLICTACYALDINEDPQADDYLFARGMRFPVQEREKVFSPENDQANFTFFHGVENVAVEDGKLGFTLSQEKATLGWGNYLGQQPIAQIEDMWQQKMVVRLGLRQSLGPSQWTVRLWRDGQRQSQTAEATLEGGEWQELTFEPLGADGANPDGLEFTIEGEKGARIELEWLKLIQPTFEGYCRTEFVLPEGRIWRAVADVGSANDRNWYGVDEMASRLYINGQVVERRGAGHIYHTAPVDIGPYLTAGRNCAGFYGFRIGYWAFLYFQARIIMESGEVVMVGSGLDWKYSPQKAEGWDEPGFDDSAWVNVKGGTAPWATARDSARRLGIPAYSGRLVMKNPERRDLFYADAADVVVDVQIPPGLRETNPVLSYLFGKAEAEGKCTRVKEGSVSSFAEEGGSLVYRVNLGRQGHGVYALALSLKDGDGNLIEERHREPLVVLRKMALKEIAGTDYTDGLDLELEDTIDFTDPNDPHPWFESRSPAPLYGTVAAKVEQPVIVRRDGLVYREVTDPRRSSGFSYRFEFKHPGSFYYLEMEYPDNGKRTIEVSISTKTEGVWTNSQSGVGAETGGRFLPMGQMLKLRWIHVADAGPHSVDIINVVDGEKAAARSLKVYRIKGDLPSVVSGTGRRYGIHTERCFYTSGIGMNFGVGTPRNRQAAKEQDEKLPLMQLFIKDLVWLQATGERYVQYLKFSGQNCHVMGCIQYNEFNSPYVPAPGVEDSRIRHCMKTMMANLFEMNGIDFYAGLEFSQSQNVRSYANNAQVAEGADTIWMVNAEGNQRYGHRLSTVVPNWLHPHVRSNYMQLMSNLADTFGHLTRFRGVHGMLGPTQRAGYWIPGFGWQSSYDNPLESSYDDVTIELLEKDTGVELPIPRTDPRRFEKRAALLGNPALRPRFVAWRAEKVKQFFEEALGTLRSEREDLQFVNAVAVEETKFFQHLVEAQKPFKTVMRDFAIDLDGLSAVDGLWAGRWTLSWRQTRAPFPSQDPYCWLSRTSPDIISPFSHDTKRYVFVRTSWDENMLATGGYAMEDRNDHDRLAESDWIMNGAKIRALPQPGGYHCREAFIQALITGDPNLLLGGFTDLNINVGHEQMLRSVMKTYTHLPNEKFTPVLDTGLETNLAIRKLTRGGQSWFYVANPCQWHVKASLGIETAGEIAELVSGRPAAAERAGNALTVPISLEPFGLVAFRVESPELSITSYEAEPLEAGDLARVESIPDRVAQLLADPEVRLSLAPADRELMGQTLKEIREAIAAHQYARAWGLMTHYRFWSLWRDFLEKAATAQARLPGSVGERQANEDPEALPVLVARRTNAPVRVDGLLAEAAWAQMPLVTGFWTSDKTRSLAETGVKALYDDENVYLAVVCADRDTASLKADAKDEMSINACRDDHVAIFIQPEESAPLYYQMAFNPEGVQFDQRVAGGDWDYDYHPRWSTATCIEPQYWATEVALPYEAFGLAGPQRAWRLNVCRRMRNDLLKPSTWSWLPGDWHDPDRFGHLRFEGVGQ